MRDEELRKFVGRTVESITRYGDGYMEIRFDDGTCLTVGAHSTEESWLDVDSLG
jgi:hypothetical protein